jgi:hypothetical protein
MAHQSRWGWYPCDYETFRLLKELHARYWKALRRFAEWRRWERKMPHNRVIRRRVVDDQGRKIGSRVVGPRPEPELDPFFCTRQKVVRHWSEEGQHFREGLTMERVAFDDRGIPEAYRAARKPAPEEALVSALSLTPDAIRCLAAQVKELGEINS